jgi:hypothetical protein
MAFQKLIRPVGLWRARNLLNGALEANPDRSYLCRYIGKSQLPIKLQHLYIFSTFPVIFDWAVISAYYFTDNSAFWQAEIAHFQQVRLIAHAIN